MSGSQGTEISFRNRRRRLKGSKRASLQIQYGRLAFVAGAVFICALSTALGQTAQGPVRITLDQAIEMALQHNHTLLAARTTIPQSQAQEITANLRPNPELFTDWDYLPFFSPSSFSSTYLHDLTEFDIGVSYLIERGKKRERRFQAAKDATAVTRSQVDDNERTLIFQVAS